MNEKFIMSQDVQHERAKIEPRPSVMGPSTSDEDQPPDLLYLMRNALPEELANFAKAVRARVDQEPNTKWVKCDKCGYVMMVSYRTPEGPCLRCNMNSYIDGGMSKEMSAKEIEKHLADKKKLNAEIMARADRAGLFFRNEERAKYGLEPLTMAEFKAEQKAEFERSQVAFKKSVELAKKVREKERLAAEEREKERQEQEAAARKAILRR